jgi:hypothetical protein
LSAQHEKAHGKESLPDLATLDVESCTSLYFITACELLQHCIIIFRVIACYISYLDTRNVSVTQYMCQNLDNTHPMDYAKSIEYTKEHLPQTCPAMRTIHLSKAEQRVLQGPLARHMLHDPMACHSKIRISVARLPCVASHADLTNDGRALR